MTVDHPMPWQPAARGQPAEYAAHLPGGAWRSREPGHIAIGDDAAAGNGVDNLEYPLTKCIDRFIHLVA